MHKMKPKSYSVLEVLNFSDVGLLFEFYTSKDSNFITSDLSKRTGKNIIITGENRYSPTYSNAILLKEYEASKARYQLNIAPQNYHSVIPIIEEVCSWITEHCETKFDTSLKFNLSFNHKHLDTLWSISQMNPSRLMLKFDESFVYSRFPERQNSPYCLSIKNLAPINAYINEAEVEKHIQYILKTPYAEFFGINFSNYTNGLLECNFVGGKDYSSKVKEIKDVLEYFIIKTYQAINEEDFNDFETYTTKKLTENFEKIQMSYWDPDVFLREFQDLKVYVDLKTSRQILKTYWSHIRTPLFEMIINGNLKEGDFNYDTELGKFQLRKGKLQGNMIKNMDLVSCEISGVLEKCNLINCRVSNARIYNSNLIKENEISYSYLQNISANIGNKISNAYIVNNEEILNCQISESVVKFATAGKDLKIDESSTFIVKEMILPAPNDSVQVDEIRDYTWVKDMRKTPDKGFQNEYQKNKYLK